MRSAFKFFASIRFAIPLLSVFTVAMIWGTIQESRFGAEYASKAVYDTYWFYALQIGIAVSLSFAVLDRLPVRRRLLGFYTVHAAILTLMAGYVVTHYFGVDGSIELRQGQFRQTLALREDVITLATDEERKIFSLPPSVYPTPLEGAEIQFKDGSKARLLEYLPYAKEIAAWKARPGTWSSRWLLDNGRFKQEITLVSTEPSVDLGPLEVRVVEPQFLNALTSAENEAHYLFYDDAKGQAYAAHMSRTWQSFGAFRLRVVEDRRLSLTYVEVQSPRGALKFFPRFSSKPVNGHLAVDEKSPYRLIDLGGLNQKKTVLLARHPEQGIWIAFANSGKWQGHKYAAPEITLPWMGFKLRLIEDRPEQTPIAAFAPALPNKDEQKNSKAVRLWIQNQFRNEEIWVSNRAPSVFNDRVQAQISPREVELPFALSLDRFQMEKIPGTDRPATYESFVRIQNDGSTAHIYMNNPLKKGGYTFYQASFLQDDQGRYHSILSVNRDPGRWIKYLGSLLLVIGLIVHFSIVYGYLFPHKVNNK